MSFNQQNGVSTSGTGGTSVGPVLAGPQPQQPLPGIDTILLLRELANIRSRQVWAAKDACGRLLVVDFCWDKSLAATGKTIPSGE